VVIGGVAKAYRFDKLAAEKLTQDEIGGKAVVLIADAEHHLVRAFERGDRTFSGGRTAFGNNFLIDQDGRPWKLSDKDLSGPEGKSFPLVPGELTTWGAWSAAHPGSQLQPP
jgi:hypothetical protein